MWIDFCARFLLGAILLGLASLVFGIAAALWIFLYDDWVTLRRTQKRRRERGF